MESLQFNLHFVGRPRHGTSVVAIFGQAAAYDKYLSAELALIWPDVSTFDLWLALTTLPSFPRNESVCPRREPGMASKGVVCIKQFDSAIIAQTLRILDRRQATFPGMFLCMPANKSATVVPLICASNK